MGFKPGQAKPKNSGRKKGVRNKKAVEFQLILDQYNFSPGEELIYVYNEAKEIYKTRKKNKNYAGAMVSLDTMSSTADKICQYVYPKKKAIEHTGEVGILSFADLVAAADEGKPE